MATKVTANPIYQCRVNVDGHWFDGYCTKTATATMWRFVADIAPHKLTGEIPVDSDDIWVLEAMPETAYARDRVVYRR